MPGGFALVTNFDVRLQAVDSDRLKATEKLLGEALVKDRPLTAQEINMVSVGHVHDSDRPILEFFFGRENSPVAGSVLAGNGLIKSESRIRLFNTRMRWSSYRIGIRCTDSEDIKFGPRERFRIFLLKPKKL